MRIKEVQFQAIFRPGPKMTCIGIGDAAEGDSVRMHIVVADLGIRLMADAFIGQDGTPEISWWAGLARFVELEGLNIESFVFLDHMNRVELAKVPRELWRDLFLAAGAAVTEQWKAKAEAARLDEG